MVGTLAMVAALATVRFVVRHGQRKEYREPLHEKRARIEADKVNWVRIDRRGEGNGTAVQDGSGDA